MRLHPRRLRPQTGAALVLIVFVISVLVWAVGELVRRFGWGRVFVGAVSTFVFLSFFFCWL